MPYLMFTTTQNKVNYLLAVKMLQKIFSKFYLSKEMSCQYAKKSLEMFTYFVKIQITERNCR